MIEFFHIYLQIGDYSPSDPLCQLGKSFSMLPEQHFLANGPKV